MLTPINLPILSQFSGTNGLYSTVGHDQTELEEINSSLDSLTKLDEIISRLEGLDKESAPDEDDSSTSPLLIIILVLSLMTIGILLSQMIARFRAKNLDLLDYE